MPAKPRSSDHSAAALRWADRALTREVETRQGLARAHVHEPAGPGGRPLGVLVLGHGAGGGVGAPDLRAAVTAATSAGWRAVLVEQPWRVAGRRVAPAPPRLDEAWLAVVDALREPPQAPDVVDPLVVGGRSAGARVACRTAAGLGAVAALGLAFPLHPPGRPDRSRAPELAAAGVPVVVVQGERDAFGGPGEIIALRLDHVEVVPAPGDHALRSAGRAVADGVRLALGRGRAHSG
ncbi:MAG TPA: alpha/beta family hydrolase [Kineosporiaceae bacterium]|nr:alpha/beta family hydrolase [Kineosporiaceae bacterium]